MITYEKAVQAIETLIKVCEEAEKLMLKKKQQKKFVERTKKWSEEE